MNQLPLISRILTNLSSRIIAIALVGVLPTGLLNGEESAQRPNVIFILTDDQRLDSLPIYGNSFVKTPHIDALAKESVVFDKASVTSAICAPSRATYFLGQYERRHAVNFNSGYAMSKEAWGRSYPVMMKKAGYYTGYVGKNHVPVGEDGYKTGYMDESFDFWYAGHGHMKFYSKHHHEIFKDAKANTQVEIVREAAQSFLRGNTFIAGAKTFLDARPDGQPFCLSICLNVPHGASTSEMTMLPTDPELYRTRYRDRMEEIEFPSTYLAKKDVKTPKLPLDVLHTESRQNIYNYVNTPESLRERMVRQYQTITGIDLMLGEIRQHLEDHNLADNTVIVLSSDHGLLLGEYGLGGKSLNYESCLAVPLIIHDPRLPDSRKGIRSQALAQSIDIAPTLLEMAGALLPSSVQGVSLVPVLEGRTDFVRSFAWAENLWSNVFGNPRCESVRNQRFKYIRYFENSRELWAEKRKSGNKSKSHVDSAEERRLYENWGVASIKGEKPVYEELFDLENDPTESINLVNDPVYSEQLSLLRACCQAGVIEARGDFTEPLAVLPLNLKAKTR